MAEWTKATVLKSVVLRAPVNEWLGPMKEAPSFEGAFLVSGAVRLLERCTEFFCWSPSMNQRVNRYLIRAIQE